MNLLSLTLRHFRCFREETTVSFADLTAIIGKNDVGKSSVLEALEIFFNNETVKIDGGDLSVSAEDNLIAITCEFNDLPASLILDTQAETSLADEFLLNEKGTLTIRKVFNTTTSRPKEEVFVSAYHPTSDQYSDLLALTNSGLKKRLRDLNVNDHAVHLNNNPSIRRAIWNSCQGLDLATILVPVAKADGKQIWEKLREHLPRFALFQSDRPSRDSDSEIQDPMNYTVATALAEPNVKKKLSEVSEAVRSSAIDLANRTHQTLATTDPNLASALTPDFKSDPKWPGLFSLTLLSDDGIPVNKRGSGVRRLILLSFFRAEAERNVESGQVPNIIYALEEPETSQHPNNQKLLLASFEDISVEPGRQVILTTHSPGFASDLPLSSFRFLHAGTDGERLITEGTATIWEDIAKTLGVTPDNRVKVLVCVEGPTDIVALRHMSRALNRTDPTLSDLLTDPRIAFIPLGGATLTHWVTNNYLCQFGRPQVHIYDGDSTHYQAQADIVNQRSDGSWAVQTGKREIENYLHPSVIKESMGVDVEVSDTDDVPKLVAEARERQPGLTNWNPKTVKKKLAAYAFPLMSADLIDEMDPNGDVRIWVRRISEMLQ